MSKKKNKKHEKHYKVDTKPVNTLIKTKSNIGISVNDLAILNLTRAGKPGVQLDALKQTEILYLYPNPSEDKPLIWSKERKEK